MASGPDNSAARLLALLAGTRGEQGGTPTREVWSRVFPESSRLADTTRLTAAVIDLSDQVAADIRQLPGEPHDKLLEWKPNVDRLLLCSLQNGDSSWGNHSSLLDDKTIYSLDLCATKLSAAAPERVLEADELKTFHDRIRELLREVIDSSLEADIKAFIVDQLHEIDRALQLYRVRGIRVVTKALEAVAGQALANGHLANRAASTPAGRSAWEVIRDLTAVSTLTENLAPFVVSVAVWLAGGQMPMVQLSGPGEPSPTVIIVEATSCDELLLEAHEPERLLLKGPELPAEGAERDGDGGS